jgi:hypothetical protein
MAERAMGPMLLLVQPPRFILRRSLSEGREVVHGRAFIAQSAVNALNEGVFHWFAGRMKSISCFGDTSRLQAPVIGISSHEPQG